MSGVRRRGGKIAGGAGCTAVSVAAGAVALSFATGVAAADPGQDELDAGISDLDPELLAGIEAAANADNVEIQVRCEATVKT